MSQFTNVAKKLVNSFLQPFGIYASRMSSSADVREIVELLKPIDSGIDLIRVGGNNDGGYLVPDDLVGIKHCFSAGVGDVSSFELDCLHRGIPSFLADYSVDAPPTELAGCEFSKKFVGAVNNDQFMTLDRWVAESLVGERDSDLLLQMDVEGAEYETLLSTTSETLKRFRIMVVEFHNMESVRDKHFCRIVLSVLRRIRENFEVVHVHPNNSHSIVSISNVKTPLTFETTFLRKDRVKSLKPVNHLPHPLDQPNLSSKADITLPSNWLLNTTCVKSGQ